MKSLLELTTSTDKVFMEESPTVQRRMFTPNALERQAAAFRKWWLAHKDEHRARQKRWTEEALIKVANGTYNPRKTKQ